MSTNNSYVIPDIISAKEEVLQIMQKHIMWLCQISVIMMLLLQI